MYVCIVEHSLSQGGVRLTEMLTGVHAHVHLTVACAPGEMLSSAVSACLIWFDSIRLDSQGMLVTETIIEHISKSLGMDAFELRSRNLYKVWWSWWWWQEKAGKVTSGFKRTVRIGIAGWMDALGRPPETLKRALSPTNRPTAVDAPQSAAMWQFCRFPIQAEEPTHFGQPLESWNVPAAWSDIQGWAEVGRRRKEVRLTPDLFAAVLVFAWPLGRRAVAAEQRVPWKRRCTDVGPGLESSTKRKKGERSRKNALFISSLAVGRLLYGPKCLALASALATNVVINIAIAGGETT